MFTGIIHATSKVTRFQLKPSGLEIGITKPKNWKVKPGDSISVNGICSTVVQSKKDLLFQYMPETLSKTNAASWKVGTMVNMESSLMPNSTLDGHIVMGHIDTVGVVKDIKVQGNSFVYKIQLGSSTGLLAAKGSVALDGISLTTVQVGKNYFTVHIIPYTLAHTNLGEKKIKDTVNVEFDILAKYVKGSYANRK